MAPVHPLIDMLAAKCPSQGDWLCNIRERRGWKEDLKGDEREKALQSRRAFCIDARRGRTLTALFRRGWGEPFAFAAGFRFRPGASGLSLAFLFLAFIFASHAGKCDTRKVAEGKVFRRQGPEKKRAANRIVGHAFFETEKRSTER